MKRLFALLVCLCLMISSAGAEDVLPRGKSIGVEKTEWENRYKAVPTMIVQSETPVYFINVGISDFRQMYYAEPLSGVSFTLMCEDTTDEVVAALVSCNLSTMEDNYEIGVEIGNFMVESLIRMFYATTPNADPDQLTEVIEILDVEAIEQGKNYEHSVDVGSVRYVSSIADGQFSCGIKSTEVFESEEAFQTYRENRQ